MNFFRSLAGTLRLELTSASVADMLTAINNAGITLTEVLASNDLAVEATVSRSQFQHLEALLIKRGDKLKILRRTGVFWSLTAMRKRPVLVVGLAIFLTVAMFLPTRILFIKVKGNHTVTSQSILDAAEKTGISFGASRAKVRSEAVKNALLAKMPELQWAGVNTYGCVAIISVEERENKAEIKTVRNVSSIVAKCDAVVRDITVTQGNALCKVGQAVKAGQVLVSGYTDCGITIKATRAEAEIFGDSSHRLCAVTPAEHAQRTKKTREVKRYSLIFGKNIINLFKDSGISPTGCVKMYEEVYLTLPGGFQLPLGLAQERLIFYNKATVCSDDIQSFFWLEQYSDAYLLSQMVAGKILDKQVTTKLLDDAVYFEGNYSCYEMIGQIYNEEIYKHNEQSS